MKKALALLLVVLTVFALCACGGNTTDTSSTASQTASKDTSSKKEKEPVDDSACYAEDGYYMIAEAAKIIKTSRDDSKLFKEGVTGYDISGGIYYVDAETMLRLTKTPCRGDGSVMLVDWQNLTENNGDHPDPFKAALATKLSDEVYMSMYLPSEGWCFMRTQDRGYNGYPANDKYKNVCSIGAIYKNYDYELPDDAIFTICISNARLLLNTEKDGWFVADDLKYPQVSDCLYYLPWQLEDTLGQFPIVGRITNFDDHVEIKLKGSDFNASVAKRVDERVLECTLHFWGNQVWLDSFGAKGSDIKGVVSSFDVWVKEPEYANYFVIGVGADWRSSASNEGINQAYESRKYTLTNEPKTCFAHNVAPSVYDEIMDTEFVKNALGLN